MWGTADIAEFLAERGVHIDPSSVFDWVQRFIPLYKEAARPPCQRVDARWAVDETYLRLAGRWVYAYRAINDHDQVIDVYLSEARDTANDTLTQPGTNGYGLRRRWSGKPRTSCWVASPAGPRSCATSRCL